MTSSGGLGVLAVWCAVLLCGAAWAQDVDRAGTDAGAKPQAAEEGSQAAVDERIRGLVLEIGSNARGKEAVAELLESGDERVERVLQLLMDRELYLYEARVVTAGPTAEGIPVGESPPRPLVDVLTGEPILDDAGQPVTRTYKELLDSRFQGSWGGRAAAKSALSVVRLMVKNPDIRREAARSVGDTRKTQAVDRLREMAAGDPDPGVRRAAAESLHIITASGALSDATPEDRGAAAEALGEMRSIRGGLLLREMLAEPDSAAGEASALPAGVRPIAEAAVRKIERHESRVRWLSYSFQGLSAGSILVLLALGLAITFGVMGVINMAHGEMLMIGAVTTWACHEFLTPLLPEGWTNWYYVVAFPLSFLAAAAVGLLVEVSIVRWLYRRPLDSLLATIGVSFVLIQAVRLWKGDNLGMSAPTWFTGGWEPMQDLILPFNRLFIIALTAACVLATAALFRFTRLGLMIRATVQDRETAKSLGVNTRLVDMLTFAYGAGLAGLAGYAVVLLSNPTPQMGQAYIVDSFLVVVVGGVGKLLGVVVSGLGIGFLTKLVEPMVIIEEPLRIFDSTWAQVLVLLVVIAFMQRKPAGLFPDKGRLADAAGGGSAWGGGRVSWRRDLGIGLILAGLGLLVVPFLYLVGLPEIPWLYDGGPMSLGMVNKLGQFTALAMVAVGLDLVWGYMGVLSLCQFMFFALGGYAMGLYLVNHGPMGGANSDVPAALFVVMSGVGDASPPWFLPLFRTLPGAVVLGLLIPGLLALLIGVTTFRSRVRGVYFAILTQAITVAAWLVFQKNELTLGGTNGLTNFTHIQGFPIASDPAAGPLAQTRFWLYIASVVALLGVLIVGKWMVRSGFGRVLIAIRDDETRLLFRGYQAWVFKAAAFTAAALFAAVGGMLYTPQMGIINPRSFAAEASILVVVWVALGGRGTLWGAAIGAIVVNLLYDRLTTDYAESWPFVLGALFIAVPLFLPGGLMSLPAMLGRGVATLRTRHEAGEVSPAVVPVTPATEVQA